MSQKIGRNEPCPCGSGKKYKNCCISAPTVKKKFKATLLSGKKETPVHTGPDLMQRTFGNAISSPDERFSRPSNDPIITENNSSEENK